MSQRDVLPNITDPTLIPTVQTAAAPVAVEESKGLFTTIAENRVIVIIIILVIIAIGLLAYFVAYKGTDKEEINAQKGQIAYNHTGQNMPPATAHQYLQNMQAQMQGQNMHQQNMQAQNLHQQNMQAQMQAQNLHQQNLHQQNMQQQNTQHFNQQNTQPEIKQQPPKPNNSNASTTTSSAIDLLNRSKNSTTNIHDSVKTMAMQNVMTVPNMANQRAKLETAETNEMLNNNGTLNNGTLNNGTLNNGTLNDEITHSEEPQSSKQSPQIEQNNFDDNNDEKLMNSMLGFEKNQRYSEQDELDIDRRFDKAFELQQENLSNVSQNTVKPQQIIAHCEYMVQGRYCKLPVQYGNKCHRHQDK